MIIESTGIFDISFGVGSAIAEPISIEFTHVPTNIATTYNVNSPDISRNDSVLTFAFDRGTMNGTYDYVILGDGSEYYNGRIKFITREQQNYYEGSNERGEYST